MGLDTSHDCFHGAYSSFHRWRMAICLAAGWGDLEDAPGYRGRGREPAGPGFTPPADKMTEGLDWPNDVLTLLLNHSDCDGEIEAEACLPLAERLEGLLPALEEADRATCESDWVRMGWPGGERKGRTVQFIAGLRRAAEAGEPVEFH